MSSLDKKLQQIASEAQAKGFDKPVNNGTNDLTKQTKQTKLGVSHDDLTLSKELIQQLPPLVKNYLNYASPLSDVPNEFLLTPFLAIAGVVIGKSRYVELGGITIYPTIWTVLFAGSSTFRKSTALNLSKKPFKPIEDGFKAEYEQKLVRWEQQKELAESNDEPFEDPKPKLRTLYNSDSFSDLTFWEDLEYNGSLISTPGEFTALWSELTRPRNGMADLALDIFDAQDSIRRNTRSGGDIQLSNPVWCMASATTLSNFQRTLTSNERGSGLLQRILPVCVEERTKQFKALTELAHPDASLYNHITRDIQQLKDLPERSVHLSEEANILFTEWSHELNDQAESLTDRLPDIGGFVSRLNVYGLKFSLIFQQLDNPESTISGPNMEAAISLSNWLFNHIKYMLDKNYIFNRHYADRLKIRELISKQPGQKMSRTDLMNLSHFDKDQLDKVLASEIEAGKIKEHKLDTGGIRPLKAYKLITGA